MDADAERCAADDAVDEASARRPSARGSSPRPSAAPPAVDRGGASFRKFRELLMAKQFEQKDTAPVQVLPRIFIGSYGAAGNEKALKAAGITHVLCVSGSLQLRFPDVFEYLQLSVADVPSEKISTVFPNALSFIDRALAIGGGVLVHCYMGRSRSATLVIAYLMARKALPLCEALALVRRARPQARPNTGFYRELVAYEAQLREAGVVSSSQSAESGATLDKAECVEVSVNVEDK